MTHSGIIEINMIQTAVGEPHVPKLKPSDKIRFAAAANSSSSHHTCRVIIIIVDDMAEQ